MNLIPQVIERATQGSVIGYDIYSRLLKDRIIFVGGYEGEFTTDSANTLIAQLLYLDSDDNTKDINLYINSPGGMVTAGLAVSPDGSALATAGEFCRGIATKTRTVGKQTPVQVAGIVTGIAGAAISAAGLALEVGSSGKLIPQSTGKMVAISLGAAMLGFIVGRAVSVI